MRISCDVVSNLGGAALECGKDGSFFVWLDTDGGLPFVHSQSGDKLLNWTLLSKETPL